MMDFTPSLRTNLLKLRTSLFNKQVEGIEEAIDLFDASDMTGRGELTRVGFETFLKSVGMFPSSQELTELIRYFDKKNDAVIDIEELAFGLKAPNSEKRTKILRQTFSFLDTNKRGSVHKQNLYSSFIAARHPRVQSGARTEDQVKDAFVQGLERYSPNMNVTEEEFLEYYSDIGASIPMDKDDYFISVVMSVWNVLIVDNRRVAEMQAILFEKLRQRTRGGEDEGKLLHLTFRHFDTNKSGDVSLDEFTKTLQNFGCYFPPEEIAQLFNFYDADKSGQMSYDEFCNFFAIKGSSGRHQFGLPLPPPTEVFEKVRNELLRRGAHGIRGLGIVFRRMDDNGDKHLDKQEFEWGLRENGHILSPMDMEKLFKYFDRNGDGRVSYDEFIRGIRGELNPRRLELVKAAYLKLDRTQDGKVNLADMREMYDVSFHPDFKSSAKTTDQILTEFMSQWDTVEKDGQVTVEEFVEYYKDVSASVDLDDEFELMIRNAWHLAGGEGWCENTTIPRHLEIGPNGEQRVVMATGHDTFNYSKTGGKTWGAEIR